MHPRSKHWHLIDYIIVRRKDMNDVRVTKSMCGANCWIDHRLVLSNMNLHIQAPRRPQGKKTPKRLNVAKLKQLDIKDKVSGEFDAKLESLSLDTNDIEQDWALFKDTVYSTCQSILGPKTHQHQDWFDDNNKEIDKLLEDKNRLHLANNNPSTSTAFHQARQTVQSRLRELKEEWLSKKADEIQGYADAHNAKRFYEAVRTLYGPQSPLLSADGTKLLTPTSLTSSTDGQKNTLNLYLTDLHPSTMMQLSAAYLKRVYRGSRS